MEILERCPYKNSDKTNPNFTHFKCAECRRIYRVLRDGGSGYGITKDKHMICYSCCGVRDAADMRRTGKAVLYFVYKCDQMPGGYRIYSDMRVTNWPGTLSLPCTDLKIGAHNIAGKQYRFRFKFEGETWHGVQYGDNTQIAHCRRSK